VHHEQILCCEQSIHLTKNDPRQNAILHNGIGEIVVLAGTELVCWKPQCSLSQISLAHLVLVRNSHAPFVLQVLVELVEMSTLSRFLLLALHRHIRAIVVDIVASVASILNLFIILSDNEVCKTRLPEADVE
jgi:ABC-type anion transport system duplicated permease subunit